MSLADFQDAWNQLLFDEKVRKDWAEKKANFRGLSEKEKEAINSFPEDRINLIAPSTVRGRSHIFFHSIPYKIAKLIDEKVRENLAYSFSVNYPSVGMHPGSKGFSEWLKYIKHTLEKKGLLVPHLEDLINYELKVAELIFYRIPFPTVTTPEPHIVSWAGLFSAGPNFKTVLDILKTSDNVNELPDNPKHGYLVTRSQNGLKIEKLHWTIFEILNRCTGQNSWGDIVSRLIEEENSLLLQIESLKAWEKYYLKEGIISL